jgi:hypothetical protein
MADKLTYWQHQKHGKLNAIEKEDDIEKPYETSQPRSKLN